MAGSISPTAAPVTSSLSKLQSLNGLFAIYKKQGPTSADVLNTLKEALLKEAGVQNPNPRKRKKQSLKIGHGGTLDSAASGVLVVGVGNGTKMLSTMLAGSKVGSPHGNRNQGGILYHQSGDRELQDQHECLQTFVGEGNTTEFDSDLTGGPYSATFSHDLLMFCHFSYSALKKDGQRLSVMLKKGHKVEAKPARPVTVYNLTLQEFKPPLFTLDIECGGGFYVRSLVDDLGKALSSCAHVKELIRTKQGQFTLEEHALYEEKWTLEHILRSLQPFSHSEQGPDCTKPAEADT
ncbi:probable tRNA pseudouridine synthase 1 [Morone saxatilis]|uniref:probable tRNA pseudouridine synthase 1 n=1 Tax=Morone saxatilis TaxID=34816 RepID=UPI0015E2244D|nr:probable tRNA pseudouridine synthase 1 [Morone saxatilis]